MNMFERTKPHGEKTVKIRLEGVETADFKAKKENMVNIRTKE